jgi:nucleoside-diphosphate-sugar epimerase
VLVTGGSGFIGSHLVDKLLTLKYRVTVLDNLETGNIQYLDLSHANLTVFLGDVTDRAAVRSALSEVTAVFHLAAASKVLPSLKDPVMATFNVDQNAIGTAILLEQIATLNIEHQRKIKKTIYAASSTYYGNQQLPYSEELLFKPSSPYAAAKYMGELLMETYDKVFDVPAVSLRFFMVYGPRQPETGAYAIVTGKFAKQRRAQQPLTIEGDGNQFRDFVHVADVVDACILALQTPEVRGTVINVGSGEGKSVKNLADLVWKDNQVHLPPRSHDLKGTLANTCRAKRELGFEVKKVFEAEMTEIVNAEENESIPKFWHGVNVPEKVTAEWLLRLEGRRAQILVD